MPGAPFAAWPWPRVRQTRHVGRHCQGDVVESRAKRAKRMNKENGNTKSEIGARVDRADIRGALVVPVGSCLVDGSWWVVWIYGPWHLVPWRVLILAIQASPLDICSTRHQRIGPPMLAARIYPGKRPAIRLSALSKFSARLQQEQQKSILTMPPMHMCGGCGPSPRLGIGIARKPGQTQFTGGNTRKEKCHAAAHGYIT
ncbi:hypothetical protein EDB81DRAFT_860088 [Dactylonectria macrodidyma]|uniref:Uncharacterized protein n=1 Tax=Dactylonectria macrodidyma TaxID=307937 RepID=A0A9P9E0G2_9HYPO|nr:hypothetical protein EDB81DRAFT_860088 [Dactylonectria macrodidyma]